MKLVTHVIPHEMRHTFTIAHGSQDTVDTFLVEWIDGEHRGYGESQAIDYYGIDAKGMQSLVDAAAEEIAKVEWSEPRELWPHLERLLEGNTFAMCAVDQAAHDLWGKRLGKPVWKLWGLDIDDNKPSDYTIGIADIDVMVAKMQEFAGWPIYKIKLGTDHDLDIIRALREHTDAIFRIDANTAWTAEQTLEFAPKLRDLGVELIEQPLPAEDWEGMRQVFPHSALPVIADESCIVNSDVERCSGFFHGINIKLTKCGGLTPAVDMLLRAQRLGLQTMVGCMTESTVGISAIAQLVPMLDYVDMDGAVLIANDIATGVRLDRGRVVYPDAPGLGVELQI